MSVNIACSVPRCTNPVIGSCTGYHKTCGKNYCHEHSLDTLCANCASQKATDESEELKYQEYLALAEKVFKERDLNFPKFQFKAKNLITAGVGSFAIGGIFLFGLILIGLLPVIFNLKIPEIIVLPYIILIIPALFITGWPVLVIPLEYISQYKDWVTKERHKRITASINEIEQEKSGFTKFWYTWDKLREVKQAEKNKQALIGVLKVVGVIAVGVIAVGAGESSYDRTRRAVRDEINR